MIPASLGELAEYCGGVVHGDTRTTVTAPAQVDSRLVNAGSLFVAVRGEHADGHDFAGAAFEAGAAAVLSSTPVMEPCVVVPDPIAALGRITRGIIDRLHDLRIVAVTGSQGKTTVKDLLGHVLAPLGPVVAAHGSFNNELGVPLTALRATEDTRFLVVEMGARGIGHIETLCRITPPDVSVVLNVGTAHLSEFGSAEAIARAKGEIVRALGPAGVAVLNDDDRRVRAMAELARGRVVTFGSHGDLSVSDVILDEVGHLELTLGWQQHHRLARVPLIGEHHAANAAAAAAVAVGEGADLDTVADALQTATPDSPMRLARTETARGLIILDDSYNANPESVAAGLRALVAIAHPREAAHGRAYAVLGEMRELGPAAAAAHRRIGSLARSLGVDEVIVVGPEDGYAAEISGGAADIATPVDDPAAAVDALSGRLRPGDVVLVKASRAARLEQVADALRDPGLPMRHESDRPDRARSDRAGSDRARQEPLHE